MIFLLLEFLIFQVNAIEPSEVQLRQFPYHLIGSRKRINLQSFVDFDIPKFPRKHSLPVANPSDDPIDAFMDTIPVETRIQVLEPILGRLSGESSGQIRPLLQCFYSGMSDNSVGKIYLNYLINGMYMESKIVSEFLKFGYGHQTRNEYERIHTCDDFAKSMRQMLKDEFSYSVKGVTPRIVHDWFSLFQKQGELRVKIASQWAREKSPAHGGKLPPTELVNLEPFRWKITLQSRLHKLIVTGYENIDL